MERVGLLISASASWSAGSPLPLSQTGKSPAYGSFPLPSELSASLRQRMLRLELTPDVARRTAKAVEDYPHLYLRICSFPFAARAAMKTLPPPGRHPWRR